MDAEAHIHLPARADTRSDLLERFLRYVRIDTQSRRERERSPSTPGQLELARLLVAELQADRPRRCRARRERLRDRHAARERRRAGTASDGRPEAPFGLLAHLDTSPDAPGAGVEPIVHETTTAA